MAEGRLILYSCVASRCLTIMLTAFAVNGVWIAAYQIAYLTSHIWDRKCHRKVNLWEKWPVAGDVIIILFVKFVCS